MTYTGEPARESVAPPNWSAPVVSSNARAPAAPLARDSPDTALARDSPDAAVRWRIGAAIIDNVIVYCLYVAVCALLHWRVAALGHAWVLVLGAVVYHFGLESRNGQTIGKRRYGIRVVALDGGAPSARAVAIRSVLRVIDQLPVWYLSGLVSMVRTGPARRQRIGDVVAGTMVVAIDRHAVEKGTPGWLLPTATIIATVLSAGSVFAIAQAGTRPLDSAQQAQFIAGCQNSPGGQVIDCGCLLNRLEAAGYDTPKSLGGLFAQAQTLTGASSPSPARAVLTTAAGECRR